MATNTFTNSKIYIFLQLVCLFRAGEIQEERAKATICGGWLISGHFSSDNIPSITEMTLGKLFSLINLQQLMG